MSYQTFTAYIQVEAYPLIDALIEASKTVKVPQDKMMSILTSLDIKKEEAFQYLVSNSAFSITAVGMLQFDKMSNLNIFLYDTIMSKEDTEGELICTVEKHNVYRRGDIVETYWIINYSFVGYQELLFIKTLGIPSVGDVIKLNHLGTTLAVTGYDEQGKMITKPVQNDKNIFPGKNVRVYKDRGMYGLGWFIFPDIMKFDIISPTSIDIGGEEIGFEISDHLPEECITEKNSEK